MTAYIIATDWGRDYGNRNEFEQVILNLLNNAKDAFIERKIETPFIEITIGDNGLSIRDNAGGIEKKNLDKIFNPYFSTKKDSDGIGLYISKMIVEQEMGGRLRVSTDESGTLFVMEFNK
ncbi:Putative two-component sensor histidine kinase [hydrothermal vent metagenome]|uniref:Putative two-component sensor histidine kinase n=1 Tax=hydrothermal vent metagenome TaxID=652676 RepID=A0A1W1C6L0_9ZZZZ